MSGSSSISRKFTTTELNATYGDGASKLPLLPAPSTILSSDRETNGLLKDAKVKDIVASLKKNGILPVYNGRNERKVNDAITRLLANGKEEFNFYYDRYKDSIGAIIDMVGEYAKDATQANIDRVNKLITDELAIATMLNRKLNDIIQIMLGIINDISSSSTNLQNSVQNMKNTLKQQQVTLMKQHRIISSNEAVAKLNKEMVKYSQEKARYSNNLLTTYSVLNIVALGLLVYVFRSTTD
jgi:hypothetical protein